MGLTNFPNGITSFGSVVTGNDFGYGIGNVYYVCQTTNTAVYADLYRRYGITRYDNDNSLILHTTIQSALDACVANRGDYVLVSIDSSDYDLTETLTMTKKGVHLICPFGFGSNGIGMNAARLDCTTDAPAVTITADCVEFAGFFIKGYLNTESNIYLSGTRWHANIHDNFVGMAASSAGTGNYGIYGDGACSHMSIHHNYVCNYSPAAMTGGNNAIAGGIVFSSASCTRNIISDNIVHTGHNTTMALGIEDVGASSIVRKNLVYEVNAHGASEASTLTLGIQTAPDSCVVDNRVGIDTEANGVIGGTANCSYIANYEPTNGGALLT